METIGSFLDQIFSAFLSLFPTRIIVRATCGGVKYKGGKKAVLLKPGIHFYWPLFSEVEILVTARQTDDLPTQALMTSDKKSLVVSALVVYTIDDVVKAIGKQNWDVTSTINAISQAVIAEIIAGSSLKELMDGLKGGRDSDLNRSMTKKCKAQLKQFGVNIQRCAVSNFSTCKVYRVMGDGEFISDENGED